MNLIDSGVYAPIFNSVGIELQNLTRHYTNVNPEKLKYLIKASLFCKFAASNNSTNAYETVEEFLIHHNGSMQKDKELENKVQKHFPTVSYSNFCIHAVHLKKFYNKKVKEDASLTLNTILSEFGGMTRDKVAEYVKIYSKQKKSKKPTAVAPLDFNNVICNSNGIVMSPLMAASNRSKATDYDKELFSDNDANLFNVDVNLWEELPSTPPPKSASSKSNETSNALCDNNGSKKPASRRSPRKRPQQSCNDKPKKKRLPPKLKPIDSTVERTAMTKDETASLVLQKQVAQLCNDHSMEEIVAATEL